jgi:hypothetical protein
MEKVKTYSINPLLASVIVLMIFAGIFSIEMDRLLAFYKSTELTIPIIVAVLISLGLFFGFKLQLFKDRVVYRHNVFFRKSFMIDELSHVLYQPTWRGVTPMTSQTNMRSLHIVRHSGGWKDTISLANGAYREEELADIAKRLRQMNPRIEIDGQTGALIKKYS